MKEREKCLRKQGIKIINTNLWTKTYVSNMYRKGKNKKVIIWDNIKSNAVEQAIFILREENDCENDYIVQEAQGVIDSFISWQASTREITQKPKKKRNSFLTPLAWISSAIALTLLYYIIYRVV